MTFGFFALIVLIHCVAAMIGNAWNNDRFLETLGSNNLSFPYLIAWIGLIVNFIRSLITPADR